MPDITIRIDDKPVLDALNRLARKMDDLSPALRVIGEDLAKSTEARFNSQGPAPDGKPWAALSPATLKRKQHSKILTELGHLRGSIRSQLLNSHSLAVGTNMVYGAVHQLGGPAGRGRKVRIPARPYLGIAGEDSDRIVGIVTRYLEGKV